MKLNLFAIICLLWYLAGKSIFNFNLCFCLYISVILVLWFYENLDQKDILCRRIEEIYTRESSPFDQIQRL